MLTSLARSILIWLSALAAHAEFKPQVTANSRPSAAKAAVSEAPKAVPGSGDKPLVYESAIRKPQQTSSPPSFSNGAGPTGTNWSSGDSGSGATAGTYDMGGSGQCGPAQDLWRAAGNVMNEGVLPPGQGYNINAPNWPKLVQTGDRLKCDFSPGKQSMCTSATAAAFCQHIADLANGGHFSLNARQVAFLNGPQVKAAINGNTFSVAYLFQNIGGSSLHGQGDNIRSVLSQARPGDVLRYDRRGGTGHSTIFKEVKGDQFCYWSSNTKTNGAGVQCENISSLTTAVVSRFPANAKDFPAKLDQAMSAMSGLSAARANAMGASGVKWASSLVCAGGTPGAGEEPTATNR